MTQVLFSCGRVIDYSVTPEKIAAAQKSMAAMLPWGQAFANGVGSFLVELPDELMPQNFALVRQGSNTTGRVGKILNQGATLEGFLPSTDVVYAADAEMDQWVKRDYCFTSGRYAFWTGRGTEGTFPLLWEVDLDDSESFPIWFGYGMGKNEEKIVILSPEAKRAIARERLRVAFCLEQIGWNVEVFKDDLEEARKVLEG